MSVIHLLYLPRKNDRSAAINATTNLKYRNEGT